MTDQAKPIDTHGTPIRFPNVVTVALFGGFCIWLGSEITGLRRDVAELQRTRVPTDQEINERITKEVERQLNQRRAKTKMACATVAQRGFYGDCTEVFPQ